MGLRLLDRDGHDERDERQERQRARMQRVRHPYARGEIVYRLEARQSSQPTRNSQGTSLFFALIAACCRL